jgi:23S rRNA pseudouridine1911/1915/1917 synthase
VAGDRVYGHTHSTVPIKRHFLHASRLTILIPGEVEPRTFEANLPDELTLVLEQLRKEE